MSQAVVQDFEDKIDNLHEVEYGDFKRKLSLYISRLEQSLPNNDHCFTVITNLREQIIFNAKGDIELARLHALNAAQKLKTLF